MVTALVLERFPGGFEWSEAEGGLVEVAVYTDAEGERRLGEVAVDVRSEPVVEGWEDAWRQFHRSVEIGPIWVGPPWEHRPAGRRHVVIEPGRAFGTGAHPTTRLCIELLVGLGPGSVVDLGCGSGVLAIVAAKLGHAPVFAIDRDTAAVEVARTNAAANGVPVEVEEGDVLVTDLRRVALAVANIDGPVLELLAPRVAGGALIGSGYLVGRRPRLPGWRRVTGRELDGWAADLYARE